MKKLLTIILTVILALGAVMGLTACGEKKQTLKIGVTDYKPMDYKEVGSDEWIGFDADLAKEVANILGYKIEFVEINWDTKVMALESKEIDIIWNGMTITEDLREQLLLSDPYLENTQVIVCQKGVASQYTTKESLANASEVLVEGGSAGESSANSIAGTTVRKMDAQKDTLLEVKTSSTKVAVIDKLMANALVGDGTDYSDLTFIEVGFEVEQFGLGFRKGDTELAGKVAQAIAQTKTSGKYQELTTKYFG